MWKLKTLGLIFWSVVCLGFSYRLGYMNGHIDANYDRSVANDKLQNCLTVLRR